MNRTMAKRTSAHSQSKEAGPVPSGDEGALSSTIRELILRFDAKDRRQRRQASKTISAGRFPKRRRRSDQMTNDADQEG